MKRIYCALLILSLFIYCSVFAKDVSIVDLAKDQGKAVVMIGTDQQSLGSGFNVDSNGLIITNYHVVKNATKILVKFRNGDIFPVSKIFNMDISKDICILKINGFDLPTVQLGNSNNVNIGEDVVAIGNPQGFENTVTNGIISGKRDFGGVVLLQTSTPISPGSSGGPLFNMTGEVIGITSASWVESKTQNINFAIPINYARGLMQENKNLGFDVLIAPNTAIAKEQSVIEEQMPSDVFLREFVVMQKISPIIENHDTQHTLFVQGIQTLTMTLPDIKIGIYGFIEENGDLIINIGYQNLGDKPIDFVPENITITGKSIDNREQPLNIYSNYDYTSILNDRTYNRNKAARQSQGLLKATTLFPQEIVSGYLAVQYYDSGFFVGRLFRKAFGEKKKVKVSEIETIIVKIPIENQFYEFKFKVEQI